MTVRLVGFFSWLLTLALCISGGGFVLAEEKPVADSEVSEVTQEPVDQQQSPELSRLVGNYQTAIEDIEADGGAFDQRLSETLFGLGKAYHEAGFQPEALQIYKRSMHVNRVNDGLYSLTQEPMLRGIIGIHHQQENWPEATISYNRLYGLYVKSYGKDDPRVLPILDEMNDWHINAYKSREKDGISHLFSSHALSNSAVDLVTKNFGPTDLKLVDHLKSLVATYYYLALHQNDYKQPESGITFGESPVSQQQSREEMIMVRSYDSGKKAYERIIRVLHNNPDATPHDRAVAYAELGDWFLLFGKRESSLNAYRNSLALLGSEPESAAMREKLFGSPKLLPTFPNIYEADEVDKTGYVRVKFKVTAQGTPRNINILEVVPEDKASLGYRAKRSVRSFRFRPKFVDDSPVASELVITLNNE